MRKLLLCIILVCGCIPKVDIGQHGSPTPLVTSGAKECFDHYKIGVANNYRKLAERVDAGEFEYVAQLIDAYKVLDKETRKESSAAINKRFADTIGSDQLDKNVAAKLLRELADELEAK